MAFDVTRPGPARRHLRAVRRDNLLGYLIALVAGVVVGAVAVIVAQVHRPARDADVATV